MAVNPERSVGAPASAKRGARKGGRDAPVSRTEVAGGGGARGALRALQDSVRDASEALKALRREERAHDVAAVIAGRLAELLPDAPVSTEIAERAAEVAAAETAWRRHLDLRTDTVAFARVLGVTKQAVKRKIDNHQLIALRDAGGWCLPLWQLADGVPNRPLIDAFWIQVGRGRMSPWTAASWCVGPHPELDGLSPVQWAAQGRDARTLRLVSERDAAGFAE
jgi:hypothetical protein